MAMRETEESLSAYLVLAGAVGVVIAVVQIGLAPTAHRASPSAIHSALIVFGAWYAIALRLVLGVAYVVAGMSVRRALPGGARGIQRLLLGSIAAHLVEGALVATTASPHEQVWRACLDLAALAITIYLVANVRRLAAEAQRTVPAPAHALARS
jgi:hypothetical protein